MPLRVTVIGRGLLGSATARHLAEAGAHVRLIGPTQPQSSGPTAQVYASHHDRSRIVRVSGHTPVWTQVNALSVAGLQTLGAHVFRAVGCLTGVRGAGPDRVTPPRLGHPVELRRGAPDGPWRFDGEALWEPTGGVLDPIALREEQVRRFVAAGGQLVEAVVRRSDDGQLWAGDEPLRDHPVVVAAGAYSAALLGMPSLARAKTEAVWLAQVPDAWLDRYAELPGWIDDAAGDGWSDRYAVGPCRYEDGRVWVKIGANLAVDQAPADAEAVARWFRSDDARGIEAPLRAALDDLWPGLGDRPGRLVRCIVCYSTTGVPYVDEVTPGRWWVGPGCGYSAMASDGLGQLAARALLGRPWPDGIRRADLALPRG